MTDAPRIGATRIAMPNDNSPPMRRTGELAAKTVADPKFERLVERLCQRGTRLVAEILAEIGAQHGIQNDIEAVVRRYLDISDAALDATGGHDLPASPIHEVSR